MRLFGLLFLVLATSSLSAAEDSWIEPHYVDQLTPASTPVANKAPEVPHEAPKKTEDEMRFATASLEARKRAVAQERAEESQLPPQGFVVAGRLPTVKLPKVQFNPLALGPTYSPPPIVGAPLTSPVVPGPWFGAYNSRGVSAPPYAFDPAQYASWGPYVTLTNKYSDGTQYPLNMRQYDYYGGILSGSGPSFVEIREDDDDDDDDDDA